MNDIANYLFRSTGIGNGKGDRRAVKIEKVFTNNQDHVGCLAAVIRDNLYTDISEIRNYEKTLEKIKFYVKLLHGAGVRAKIGQLKWGFVMILGMLRRKKKMVCA